MKKVKEYINTIKGGIAARDARIKELEEKVANLEEDVLWRKELLKSRTETLYLLIQQAQDCLGDLPEGMIE